MRLLCIRSYCQGKALVYKIIEFFPTHEESHNLVLFEEECLSRYLRNQDTVMLSTQDEKLRMISER